jgi:hypothetical protein
MPILRPGIGKSTALQITSRGIGVLLTRNSHAQVGERLPPRSALTSGVCLDERRHPF